MVTESTNMTLLWPTTKMDILLFNAYIIYSIGVTYGGTRGTRTPTFLQWGYRTPTFWRKVFFSLLILFVKVVKQLSSVRSFKSPPDPLLQATWS